MLINEKRYRKKSPEALALEHSIAHHLLFAMPIEELLVRDMIQSGIDAMLQMKAMELAMQEKEREAIHGYVT
ncbi:MAG: hypothetical protein QW521_02000 [Desulfurococcaceae archaeon]